MLKATRARTVSEHYPSFEDMIESAAKCRFDLNKEMPNVKIVQVTSVIEKGDTYILHTELIFEDGNQEKS